MKYEVLSGTQLEKLPKIYKTDADKEAETSDQHILHEGDGELLGICIMPGKSTEVMESKGDIALYCRDLIEIMKIDKKALVGTCETKMAEKKALGYEFVNAHYSNMSPINLKFKQRLSVKGPLKNLTFYFKV